MLKFNDQDRVLVSKTNILYYIYREHEDPDTLVFYLPKITNKIKINLNTFSFNINHSCLKWRATGNENYAEYYLKKVLSYSVEHVHDQVFDKSYKKGSKFKHIPNLDWALHDYWEPNWYNLK